jgi:tRNA-specific 2-thiouridylase
MRSGPIVTEAGAVVGEHSGAAGYTVGQRRGLGLAGPQRSFVTAVDAAANVVVVGAADDLGGRDLRASAPRWVDGPPKAGETLQARIRYHSPPAEATVSALDGDSFRLEFALPVRAIAPGQAVVLYRGDEVVGGGTIEPARG